MSQKFNLSPGADTSNIQENFLAKNNSIPIQKGRGLTLGSSALQAWG